MPNWNAFRTDRAISMSMARVLSVNRPPRTAARFPILMYHGINAELGSRHPYFETSTSPAAFRLQMTALAKNCYETLNLTAGIAALSCDGGTARKLVGITFDDGYADFYDTALPILVELGFKATVFIVTHFTGRERKIKDGKHYMTWREVRELPLHGVCIGSHTVTHGKLSTMTPAQVDNELRESKEVIEDKLGAPVESFAYPYAFPTQNRSFVQFLRERLQIRGYRNGVSTTIGTAKAGTDRYFLPRLPVNTFDDQAFLRAKIEGGYEWLRALQQAKKTMMTAFS